MIICRKPKGVLTFCGERAIVVMNLGRFFLEHVSPDGMVCVIWDYMFFVPEADIPGRDK